MSIITDVGALKHLSVNSKFVELQALVSEPKFFQRILESSRGPWSGLELRLHQAEHSELAAPEDGARGDLTILRKTRRLVFNPPPTPATAMEKTREDSTEAHGRGAETDSDNPVIELPANWAELLEIGGSAGRQSLQPQPLHQPMDVITHILHDQHPGAPPKDNEELLESDVSEDEGDAKESTFIYDAEGCQNEDRTSRARTNTDIKTVQEFVPPHRSRRPSIPAMGRQPPSRALRPRTPGTRLLK